MTQRVRKSNYINDFQFHDGETHPNPLLLVSLNDENGINATAIV